MKILKSFLLLIVVSFSMVSCYDDYVKDFDNDAIYFPRPFNVRTVVVGEGMRIKVGTVLGGVIQNDRDRNVEFRLNNDLVTSELLTLMKKGDPHIKNSLSGVSKLIPLPAHYFKLSDDSKMIIKKGMHTGTVVVEIDSLNFVTDSKTIQANYVLPFEIVSADADKVLDTQKSSVIGLKYENMLFGNYWYGGVKTTKANNGEVVKEEKYYTYIPSPESRINILKTVGPHTLETSRFANNDGKLRLELLNDGITINVSKAPGSTTEIEPDGSSIFNKAKLLQNRKIFLSYKYANSDGTTTYVKDTLTFRNRIRDGVNEWQDEEPSHYN